MTLASARLLCLVALCGVAVAALVATAAERPARTPELIARGKHIYARECLACHGAEGDGSGPGAYILAQQPRNFQLGTFKIRSTPSGQPPADDDLFQTITRGVQGATGAMMPSFRALPEADRWALVEVVKEIAGIDKPGKPITVPAEPRVNVALGRQVYDRLQCAACHGTDGRGDGSSSLTLVDDQKRRIWTPDLSRGRFKGGNSPADIYTRIATGLDGSPMPSYANKASPAEIWALAHYILSLSTGASGEQDQKKGR
jgi:mono/diheme cytochrome c family protein